MDTRQLTSELKREADRLGFALSGVCAAVPPPGYPRLLEWLERGYAGEMRYLPERATAYADPGRVLDGARSIVMLALPYHAGRLAEPAAGSGRVARYACGNVDYHDLIHDRLRALADWLQARAPQALVRGVVDTAPLMERDYAQLAGLGWLAKNTLLIHPRLGSYLFLAALLTDLELECDVAHEVDHCGSCRACLDACPTSAFPQPYVLDATRCISYLTIELREGVPAELRAGVGDWLFGCDVCQEVCPWNEKRDRREQRPPSPGSVDPTFAPVEELQPVDDLDPVALAGLFDLDDDAFRRRFRRTPLWRSKRRGLLRNAALVLGNQAAPAGRAPLEKGLHDPEPLIRAAAAWALGRYDDPQAQQALQARRDVEREKEVLREIEAALGVK